MGCNTSQDAMQAVESKVEAARVKSQELLDGGKTKVNNFKEEVKTAADEIDIDLEDPKTEEAATKIQAVFRGHQTRRNMKPTDKNPEPEQNLEEEFSADDKELCAAATKIQASFRGHLARKTGDKKEDEELSKELEKLEAKAPEEELDIDLSDPDLQVAATKIQASFRGHKVRKEKIAE